MSTETRKNVLSNESTMFVLYKFWYEHTHKYDALPKLISACSLRKAVFIFLPAYLFFKHPVYKWWRLWMMVLLFLVNSVIWTEIWHPEGWWLSWFHGVIAMAMWIAIIHYSPDTSKMWNAAEQAADCLEWCFDRLGQVLKRLFTILWRYITFGKWYIHPWSVALLGVVGWAFWKYRLDPVIWGLVILSVISLVVGVVIGICWFVYQLINGVLRLTGPTETIVERGGQVYERLAYSPDGTLTTLGVSALEVKSLYRRICPLIELPQAQSEPD